MTTPLEYKTLQSCSTRSDTEVLRGGGAQFTLWSEIFEQFAFVLLGGH